MSRATTTPGPLDQRIADAQRGGNVHGDRDTFAVEMREIHVWEAEEAAAEAMRDAPPSADPAALAKHEKALTRAMIARSIVRVWEDGAEVGRYDAKRLASLPLRRYQLVSAAFAHHHDLTPLELSAFVTGVR